MSDESYSYSPHELENIRMRQLYAEQDIIEKGYAKSADDSVSQDKIDRAKKFQKGHRKEKSCE